MAITACVKRNVQQNRTRCATMFGSRAAPQTATEEQIRAIMAARCYQAGPGSKHPPLLGPRLPRSSCIMLLGALVAIASSKAPAADVLPCARFAQEDLPQPSPRGDRRGLDQLEKINQAVKNTSYSVLLLGDSLIEGWF